MLSKALFHHDKLAIN